MAWELFRDGYATDRLNDASNGLEFFSLSLFVTFCNKSHHLGWVLILPLLPSVKNLQCQAFLNMILVVLEQTRMGHTRYGAVFLGIFVAVFNGGQSATKVGL